MANTSSAPQTVPLIREDQIPHGFSFAAARAGLKASGNPDLACAVADQPAVAAAMFTSNKVIAAPLIVGQRHLQRSNISSAWCSSMPATQIAPLARPASLPHS